VFVMVRPRAGNFVYSREEVALMCQQAMRARSLGASGIVSGALTGDGSIDRDAFAAIADAAGPLPVTCHRAFDSVPDRDAALESLVALGVARVLTSGGAPSALSGAEAIARLVRNAAGRLVVMAGGGIRAPNVREIVARTGVTEVHAHLTTSAEVRAVIANL
jgi:copper homeostasis protein